MKGIHGTYRCPRPGDTCTKPEGTNKSPNMSTIEKYVEACMPLSFAPTVSKQSAVHSAYYTRSRQAKRMLHSHLPTAKVALMQHVIEKAIKIAKSQPCRTENDGAARPGQPGGLRLVRCKARCGKLGLPCRTETVVLVITWPYWRCCIKRWDARYR